MAYHGKNGNIVSNGVNIANLESYSLSRVGETAPVTAMGDTWEVFLAGLTDFTATAEGKSQIALDTTALLGVSGSTEFSMQTAGVKQTAAAIVTGITETAVVDDAITISYSFEGNDAAGFVGVTTGGAAPTPSANAIHGKHIKAEWGPGATEFVDLTGWTITMSCPVSDATPAHATNCGRVKLAGANTATATVTMLTPDTDLVVLEGEEVALNLHRSQTNTDGRYEGTAICTGSETGVDRTGTEVTTMSFLYTGEVDLVVSA
jgi:hypothetical protein